MNLQRRDEIRTIAECPNDMHWAQEMRRAVAELLAHIDTLESMRSRLCNALGLPADSAPETVAEAVEARRVVVPEPTYDEWRAIAENARSADMVDFLAGAAAYGLWLREHSRAIPMKDLAKLRDDFNEWAISRATGNAEIEHQKADALWKTWCMIEIPHPTSVQLNEGETRTLLDVLNREPRDLPWFRAPDFQLELPDSLRANQGGAAAERVITDGSRGPTPGHAGEGGAWVPPTPVTDAALVEVRSWIHAVGPVGAMVWVDPQEVLKIAGVRVLGDGMLSIYPDALNSISDALREIGDTAHNASTGPEVPDALWEIREKAYGAYIVATDAEAEIMQTANAHAALSSLRANQGGADHD